MKERSRPTFYYLIVATIAALVGTSSSSLAQSSASPYTTAYRYNAVRQLTGMISPDPDGGGPLRYAATRNSYNTAGQLVAFEEGELATWQSEAIKPENWSGFTVFRSTTMTYDDWGRRLTEKVSANGVAETLTQYGYDSIGRLECRAKRMNPASFSSPPSSACVLGPTGEFGPDRITRTLYDAANRIHKIQKAYGTVIQQDYATYTYGGNGNLSSVTDANGNRAEFEYDSYDRRTRWYFPSESTPGQINTGDYEEYDYDANGNLSYLRRRDGQVITYIHDALDRITTKNVPGTVNDVYFAYDLTGSQLYARLGSTSGQGTTNVFDGFQRLLSTTSNMGGVSRTIGYLYDDNGNRTRITHPDGVYFTYVYDGLNRVSEIRQGSNISLVDITYDRRGRRSSVERPNGAATSLDYDGMWRLKEISQNISGSADDVEYEFVYNPADQIVSREISNNRYEYTDHNINAVIYTPDGLNQYDSVGDSNYDYDANGNITSNGSMSFTYDVENRLRSASGSSNAMFEYDPVGRLSGSSIDGTSTRFLYDEDRLIAEYNDSGVIINRFVHGPGKNKPLVWYAGSVTDSNTRRYLYVDHLGSVTAVTNDSGTAINVNTYGSFGIAGSQNIGRFTYTGQVWLPEISLYYFKTRMYSPEIGRFLQTDPAGIDDNVNLYMFVQNDPVSHLDYGGLDTHTLTVDLDLYAIGGGGLSGGVYFNPGVAAGERLDFGVVGSFSIGFGYDGSFGLAYSKLFNDASKLNGTTDFIEGGVGWLAGRYSEGGQEDCCLPEVQVVEVGFEISPVIVSGATGKEVTGKFGYADVADSVGRGVKAFSELPKWAQQKVLQYLNERFKAGAAATEMIKEQEQRCNRALSPEMYCSGG